ncbi:MAG: ATP-binding protein, partial [Nanoarchaeota archaeon]
FFLVKYIEQWGTGTNRIIKECIKQGLPEPRFEELAGSVVVTFRKYFVTEESLSELNERQKIAVKFLLEHKEISNFEYRQINPGITDRTALNDLQELVRRGMIEAKGEKKHTRYALR